MFTWFSGIQAVNVRRQTMRRDGRVFRSIFHIPEMNGVFDQNVPSNRIISENDKRTRRRKTIVTTNTFARTYEQQHFAMERSGGITSLVPTMETRKQNKNLENPATKRFSKLCNMKNSLQLSDILFLHGAFTFETKACDKLNTKKKTE